MSDQQTPPVFWPDFWEYTGDILAGEEITDWVVTPVEGGGTTLDYRMQNEAANQELIRRGGADRWGEVVPSGEVAPYAIAWVNTVTGETLIEEGS